MSTQPNYLHVLEEAKQLPREERLILIARLAEGLRNATETPRAPRRWEDYAGSFPAPMCREDAQEWVTRTRQESDEGRKSR